jgi:hypothetical protein
LPYLDLRARASSAIINGNAAEPAMALKVEASPMMLRLGKLTAKPSSFMRVKTASGTAREGVLVATARQLDST